DGIRDGHVTGVQTCALPIFVNSSWDAAAEEIVVKHYVNLGIAVAAERGLIVPNIKHADAMTLPELARGLQALAETGRAGKATPRSEERRVGKEWRTRGSR